MAVSTVSSLSESFMSGVPVGNDDGVLNKDKAEASQEVGTLDKEVVGADVAQVNRQEWAGKGKDEEESSELTEQSDDDGGMLEVHD
jgi:cleavage and polyadenylation specificity factor subunit 3